MSAFNAPECPLCARLRTAGLEGGENAYEFCDGNPLMRVDPSGLQSDSWWARALKVAQKIESAHDSFVGGCWSGLSLGHSDDLINWADSHAKFMGWRAYTGGSLHEVGSAVGQASAMFIPVGDVVEGIEWTYKGGKLIETLSESRLAGKSYAEVKEFCAMLNKGLDKAYQFHSAHIVPGRFDKLLGAAYKNMPAVALTKEEHIFFDNVFNSFARGRDHDLATVINAARETYKGYPDLLEIALKQLGVEH